AEMLIESLIFDRENGGNEVIRYPGELDRDALFDGGIAGQRAKRNRLGAPAVTAPRNGSRVQGSRHPLERGLEPSAERGFRPDREEANRRGTNRQPNEQLELEARADRRDERSHPRSDGLPVHPGPVLQPWCCI